MIETVPLFLLPDLKLVELLKTLLPADWDKPAVARLWSVKDVAARENVILSGGIGLAEIALTMVAVMALKTKNLRS